MFLFAVTLLSTVIYYCLTICEQRIKPFRSTVTEQNHFASAVNKET